MPNPIKRLLDGAAAGYAKSFPFNGGVAGSGGLAGAPAFDLNALNRSPLFLNNSPGSARNWQDIVGPRHLCSVVGICLNWYIGTIQAAPIYVAQKNGKTADDKVAIDRHPMEMLIRRPNPYYSGSLLWAGTLLDYRTRGNAYWFKVRDKADRVVQLWWIPSLLVAPRWSVDAVSEFIDGYVYQKKLIPAEDVIHFKHGLDPATMGRTGLDPLASVLRSLGAVNSAESFAANLLLNNATPSLLITPDASLFRGDNAVVDRAALTAMTDPKMVKQAIIDKTSGDNVGKPLVWDVPFIIQKLGFSPEELALDKLQAIPIDVVCAAMGGDPMVFGLPSDRQTHSNYKEAVQSCWENSVIPMHSSWGETLDVQLLPDFHAKDNQSTEWDYSGVPALQEDKNELWNTALEAWKGNGIDRATYKKMIGQTPEDADKGMYFADIAPAGSGGFDGQEVGHDGKPIAQPPANANQPKPTSNLPSNQAKATKSDDGDWITLGNGVHINLDNPPAGFTGSHIVSAKEVPDKATRSEIAKASAYTVGAEIQRYAEETNEPILAKAVGGVSLRDNEPVDVMVIQAGIVQHGVEMKTMVNNKAGQISMKKEAVARKQAWVTEHMAPMHTVVFDDQKVFNADGPGKHDESKRTIYYRRGFGAFSVSAMHVVPDMAHLSELMNMEDKNLPKAAQPPRSYVPPPPRESKSWASTYK